METNPYNVPEASESRPRRGSAKATSKSGFRSARGRAVVTMVALGFCIVLSTAAIFSYDEQLHMLGRIRSGEKVGKPEALESDARVNTLAQACNTALLITGIVFLIWQSRVHRNLPALGSVGLEFTHGWAIGWWFVPVLSIVRPYQVMCEIWKGSDPATVGSQSVRWRENAIGWVLPCWWFSYILWSIVTFPIVGMSINPEKKNIDELIYITSAWMCYRWLEIVAGLLAIAVVFIIDQRQSAAHDARIRRVGY